ncbi:hypothetical protein FQN57_004375 [Myotisia sp. PD_48]|nr:hypothetical protein FQN57_004375 [Myotisia sp. PD_48]
MVEVSLDYGASTKSKDTSNNRIPVQPGPSPEESIQTDTAQLESYLSCPPPRFSAMANDRQAATANTSPKSRTKNEIEKQTEKKTGDAKPTDRKPLSDRESALHLAVKNNHIKIVAMMLKAGVDVNCPDKDNWTALQKATSYHLEKSEEMVKLLLSHGADVHAVNDEGMTALAVAARKELHTISDILLKAGSEINPSDRKKVPWSPYLLAAWVGNVKLMQTYINWGANTNATNHEGWNALHIAARQNHIEVIRFVIGQKTPLSIHSTINDKRTALHIAARYKNLEIARLLISSGVDLHHKNKHGYTALHSAAEDGDEAMITLLLNSGCDIHAKGHDDWTPLSLAVYGKKAENARLLMDKGKASMEVKNTSGWTPLLIACRWGLDSITQDLVDRGANARAVSNMKRTPLHLATWHKHPKVVRILVALDIDVDAADQDGWTALHMAARLGEKELVRLLLNRGANPNAKFSPGGISSSPLQQAAEQGNDEVVEMIMEAQTALGKWD